MRWHDDTIRDVVTQPGARSAMAIQRAMAAREEPPELRLRIGMHLGDVIQTGNEYLGLAVNKAARITAAAEGGEIMVSSVVRAMLEDSAEFTFDGARTVELKGLDGVREVSQLLVTSPAS